MARNREADKAIRQVADRVLALVVNAPELVEMITEREIARRIAAGELMKAESLRNATFEMVPVGRVAGLNEAVDTALRHLDVGEIREAIEVLEATIPEEELERPDVAEQLRTMGLDDEPEDDDDPEDDEPEDEQADAAEPAPRRRPAPEVVVDDDEDDPARPLGMPDLTKKYDCQGCEAPITGEQAQRSTITCRAKLCRDCVPRWDLKTRSLRPLEPAPEGEPEPDPETAEAAPEPAAATG